MERSELAITHHVAYWLGFSVSIHSCATVCGNCLANEDRATGMMICEPWPQVSRDGRSYARGVVVTLFGGVSVNGIRPLFFQLDLNAGTFINTDSIVG
jgi:hypothetical protein